MNPEEPRESVPDDDRAEELQELGSEPGELPPPEHDEGSEADLLEQAREEVPGERRQPLHLDPEVPEADALEQATELAGDDDELT
jgi:hypothetical protein